MLLAATSLYFYYVNKKAPFNSFVKQVINFTVPRNIKFIKSLHKIMFNILFIVSFIAASFKINSDFKFLASSRHRVS